MRHGTTPMLNNYLKNQNRDNRVRIWEYDKRGKGGGDRELEDPGVGSDGPWYDGTETGDSWVE